MPTKAIMPRSGKISTFFLFFREVDCGAPWLPVAAMPVALARPVSSSAVATEAVELSTPLAPVGKEAAQQDASARSSSSSNNGSFESIPPEDNADNADPATECTAWQVPAATH